MDPTDDRLELFFSQSLDGFFFMMLDEPITWNDSADKDALLDYALDHHRMTKANQAMLRQYGATREEFIGITPRRLFAHDLAYGRRVWREFFDRGRLHVETEERRFDGDPIFIEGDYICFYDAEGRITGHFGIQRDVTERRRAFEQRERELEMLVAVRTAELAISEHRTRAILSALPDLVFLIDEDGRYVEILSAASQLLAKAADELKGRLFHDVFPKATADAFLALVRSTLQTGSLQTMEYQLTVPAGDRWFEGRTAVLPVDLTEKRCVVFTARDITDTKRAEELESQNVYLREELNLGRTFGDIVGASEAMRAVFKSIEMVAPTDSTVLILGETGTGKELMASAIHEASKRRRGVMVKVNCAALPPTLVESELFGHERGAFTGALQQKKGRFELAHRGTIFLDEIGELPLEMQVKLLRVLQEQELERVGGTQTVKVDVRVVAATNQDLSEAVRDGKFRADLFYRLNIFPVRMPPLRERLHDIPLLATHFVRQFAERMGKPARRVAPGTLERLAHYQWPGNVRELANVLERAVILCNGAVIHDEHIGSLASATSAQPAASFPTLEEVERQHLLRALEQTGGVLAGPNGAARLLGLSRSTAWSRMRKLGIAPPRH
jgi:formate hydrogenlyase transcriptional activator